MNISSKKQILRLQGGFCMERKIEIPEMKKENIVKWYATIRPIVINEGKPVFMRQLKDKELTDVAYIWLNEDGDYGEKVDFTKLSVLADVKMLHDCGYYGLFKPSVGEVISQIPNELLEKAVAFQIIYKPYDWADFNLFRPDFDAGYHVSVVRLYQPKDDSNPATEEVINYPNEESTLPIGMSEDEFKKLKELMAQRF